MSKLSVATLLAVAVAFNAFAEDNTAHAAAATSARGASTDPGYAIYRRVVLGYGDETDAGAVEEQATYQWTEGPYARYLMNNGFARADAVQAAERIGERLREMPVYGNTAQNRLTSFEAYQKVVEGRSISEVQTSHMQTSHMN